MQIFDTHAHYDDEQFDQDRDKVIKSLREENVTKCINIGCDIETSQKAIAIADKYDFIYVAIGIHPSEITKTEKEITIIIVIKEKKS